MKPLRKWKRIPQITLPKEIHFNNDDIEDEENGTGRSKADNSYVRDGSSMYGLSVYLCECWFVYVWVYVCVLEIERERDIQGFVRGMCQNDNLKVKCSYRGMQV